MTMGLFDILKISNKEQPVETAKDTAHSTISQRQVFRQFEDLRELELAIQTAENVYNPNRLELHRIFDRVEEDVHYQSQWNARKNKVIEREFKICDINGDVIEEWQDAFQNTWFYDLMHKILDTKLRGYTCITFGEWQENKFVGYKDANGKVYDAIDTIPPRHIVSEYCEILKLDTDYRGVSVFDPRIIDKTLFLGTSNDYGLTGLVAEDVLIKHNVKLNWSEFAEKFGMDLIIGRTDADAPRKKQFLKTLFRLGSNGIGVFNTDDSIEYIGTNRPDAYNVYKELIESIDKTISNLVFGQDVVMNQSGRVLGTAAENMADTIMESDSRYLKSVINDFVFDKLRANGATLPNEIYFKWENSENLSLKERIEIDSKIALMGKRPTKEYLERIYDIDLEDVNIASIEEVQNRLKDMY